MATNLKENPKQTTDGQKGQSTEISPRTPSTPALATSSPFGFMRRFAEEMDRLFEDYGFGSGMRLPSFLSRSQELFRREAGLVPAEWSPRIDIVQQGGNFAIRADLPGMSKDDVKVELTDDAITIQGERKQEKKEEREGYLYNECSYGSFYRAIPLPEGVDTSKATAEFRNGVLNIAMPMAPRSEPQAKRLEVREAK